MVKPYDVHARSMSDYTNLGVQKQDALILKTNGVSSARDQYDSPASMCLVTFTPLVNATIAVNVGYFVYRVEYEFSGMKAPGLTSLFAGS